LKKLDEYVLRELIVPFLIGTVAVVLMFQINAYMYMAKTYNLENIPYEAVVQYILFRTPEFLKMTLPVGAAMGTALAVTRLARESEITAMRAAGAKITRVVLPIAAFGLAVSILDFWIVERVAPTSTKRANEVLRQAGVLGVASAVFKENALIELGRYTASLGTVQRDGNVLQITDVLLFERPQPGVMAMTTAKSAVYDRGVWRFTDAWYYQFEGDELTIARPKQTFDINEKIVIDGMFSTSMPEEKSIEELRGFIDGNKKIGLSTKKDEIELQTRFSLPVACLVFSIVSPVFAIFFARSGGFVGVLVSFVTSLLYYNAFVVSTQILGKMEFVPVWAAAWLPNIIFASLGLLALRRLE